MFNRFDIVEAYYLAACDCAECLKQPIEPNIEVPFGKEKDLVSKVKG